jgi:hypothetical protein
MEGAQESADELVAAGEIGLEGAAGRLVAEGEEAADGGEERGGVGGHEQQEAEQIGNGNGLVIGLPVEAALQGIAGLVVDDGGGDGRIRGTHRQLLSSVVTT